MKRIFDGMKAVLFLAIVAVCVCTLAWLPKKVEDLEGDRDDAR